MSPFNRRDALKTLVTVGAGAAAAACVRPEGAPPRAASDGEARSDAVIATQPLGEPPWPTLDPFLFCVHHDDAYPAGNERFGPAASLAGRDIGRDFAGKDGWRMYHGDVVPGFPAHPHRGFETVTVVRRGLLDHSDSLGAAARYGGGDVQWLTAGAGILHAEMFPLLDREGPNPVELFQIWLNLPRADKLAEPHFSMLWSEGIPRVVDQDDDGNPTEVTVVAGRFRDVAPPSPPPRSWGTRAEADLAIWTLKLGANARFTLPKAKAGTNRALYFFAGDELVVGGQKVPSRSLVRLRPDVEVGLRGGALESELLLLQGRPLDEPVVKHGPFVMNTREEIQQAYADYRRTRFGGWSWPSNDPVHAREGRFARHADGKVERPV